jgi:hypothetical protein
MDVQVSVASLDLPDDISDRLSREGYTLLLGAWSDHVPCNAEPTPELWSKRYARASVGARRAHVHIRRHGAPNERYALLFRDYLRTSTGAAGSCALIKQELVARHSDEEDAYYAVKDPVCDLIMDAAERWATATDWDRTKAPSFPVCSPLRHATSDMSCVYGLIQALAGWGEIDCRPPRRTEAVDRLPV